MSVQYKQYNEQIEKLLSGWYLYFKNVCEFVSEMTVKFGLDKEDEIHLMEMWQRYE